MTLGMKFTLGLYRASAALAAAIMRCTGRIYTAVTVSAIRGCLRAMRKEGRKVSRANDYVSACEQNLDFAKAAAIDTQERATAKVNDLNDKATSYFDALSKLKLSV